MAKSVHNDVLDGALLVLRDNANQLCICSAEPTTYAQATSTYMLAQISLTTGGAGDYTISDGDVSGRKIRTAAKSGTVTNSGTANHVALVKTSTSTLLYVTTCTSQVLTAGNTVNTSTWDVEIADPT